MFYLPTTKNSSVGRIDLILWNSLIQFHHIIYIYICKIQIHINNKELYSADPYNCRMKRRPLDSRLLLNCAKNMKQCICTLYIVQATVKTNCNQLHKRLQKCRLLIPQFYKPHCIYLYMYINMQTYTYIYICIYM